jgi:Holliday junction DNA helicase RuvA
MLAYLQGTIQLVQPLKRYLVVVVNRLGYKVHVPTPVLSAAQVGSELELYLYHVVREDADDLYGFNTAADLDVFEQLISVSGVGPKVGLALLSDLSAPAIRQAIINGDKTLLTQVSGVGKKTAERLILELQPSMLASGDLATGDSSTTIVSALQQLGYSTTEIRSVLQQLDKQADVEQQLKQALKLLSHG